MEVILDILGIIIFGVSFIYMIINLYLEIKKIKLNFIFNGRIKDMFMRIIIDMLGYSSLLIMTLTLGYVTYVLIKKHI